MSTDRTPPRSSYADFVTVSDPTDVVMTPPHIARFMADIADPQPDSVILDPACGTGNLLVACTQGQLVGVEQEPHLFSVSRVRLSEKANLYNRDCFQLEETLRGVPAQRRCRQSLHLVQAMSCYSRSLPQIKAVGQM